MARSALQRPEQVNGASTRLPYDTIHVTNLSEGTTAPYDTGLGRLWNLGIAGTTT